MDRFAFTDVAEPHFANAEETAIDCLVTFPAIASQPLPFTAAAIDPEAPHSEEIFRRCLEGEFGPVGPMIALPQPIAEIAAAIADERRVIAGWHREQAAEWRRSAIGAPLAAEYLARAEVHEQLARLFNPDQA